MIKVEFKVYTQYYDIVTDTDYVELEETNEVECDTMEDAWKCADKDTYGWLGSYVEVYVDGHYYRDYEVEEQEDEI